MDGDNNIHRLRVLNFGNTARTEYFVEQLGDHADYVSSDLNIQRSSYEALDFNKSTKKDQCNTIHAKPSQTVKTHPVFSTSTFRDQGDTYPHRKNNEMQTDKKIQKSIKDKILDKLSISNEEQRKTDVNKPRLFSEEKHSVSIKTCKHSKSGEIPVLRSEKPKCNCGIFKIPPKQKVKTKHTRHKIFIFDDIMRSFSHHSFKCSDRIKDAAFNRNKSLKLKADKKNGKKLNDLGERKDNDRVLCLRDKENKSITCKKRRQDIFGFGKCNRLRTSISVYQQYRSRLFRSRKHKNKGINPRISHSTDSHVGLRLLAANKKCAKSVDSCENNQFNTVHVNVVQFPQKKCLGRQKPSKIITPEKVSSQDMSCSKCRSDAVVETFPLCCKNVSLDPEPEVYDSCDYCNSCDPYEPSGPCDPCDTPDPCKTTLKDAVVEEDCKTTTVLKYILFVLAVLVWSPCIIMVIICWLITYPLRPSCISARARYGLNQKLLPCGECVIQSGFWTSFVNWIKSAEWFNRGAYKAVASLIKTPSKNKADIVCEHQLHPNENKRYTLYHCTGRGWIMKPTKSSSGKQKKTEILNVACDIDDPYKKKSKSIKLKGDKKKVRIEVSPPTRKRQDYGTMTPKTVKCRKCKPKSTDKYKVITSQRDVPHQDWVPPYLHGQQNWWPFQYKDTKHNTMSGIPYVSRSDTRAKPPCIPCREKLVKHLKEKVKSEKSKKRLRMSDSKEKGNQVKSAQRKVKQGKVCIVQDKSKYSKIYLDKCRQRKLMQDKSKYDETKRYAGCIKYEWYPKTCKKRDPQGNVCIRALKDFKDSIDEMEKAIWQPEIQCQNPWINTLRRKPCFWMYENCSSWYGNLLGCRKVCGDCCKLLLLCLSTVIWFPPIFCCYMCFQVFCKICS